MDTAWKVRLLAGVTVVLAGTTVAAFAAPFAPPAPPALALQEEGEGFEVVRHSLRVPMARIHRRGGSYYYVERRGDGSVRVFRAFPLMARPSERDWSSTGLMKRPKLRDQRLERKVAESEPIVRQFKTQKSGEVPGEKTRVRTRKKSAALTKLGPATGKSSKSISCDAGAGIIADYGFSDVKPTSCSGRIYAFTATRDGAGYSVQVTSADGEISKVTKQ